MAKCLRLLCVIIGLISTFRVEICSSEDPVEKPPVQKVVSHCSLVDIKNSDFVKVEKVSLCDNGAVNAIPETSLLCIAARNLTSLLCKTLPPIGSTIGANISDEDVTATCKKMVSLFQSVEKPEKKVLFETVNLTVTEQLSSQDKCEKLCGKNRILCQFVYEGISRVVSKGTDTTPVSVAPALVKEKVTSEDEVKQTDAAATAIKKKTAEIKVPQSQDESEGVEKPEEIKTAEKPDENKPAEKPEEIKTAEKPDENKPGEKPEEIKTAEKPGESKPAEKPEESDGVQKPEESDGVQKPEESEVTEKPEESDGVQKPEESEVAEKPEESKPAKKPEENKNVQKPEDGKDREEEDSSPVDKNTDELASDYDLNVDKDQDDETAGHQEISDASDVKKEEAEDEEGHEHHEVVLPEEDFGDIAVDGGKTRYTVGVDPDDGNSHFFVYFITVVGMSAVLYIVFHNKKKILALILEGRNNRGRRPNSAQYRKLDNNLDEVITGSTKKVNTGNIIY